MKDKILIQSEAADKSTDDVLSWIKYLNPAKKVEQMFDKGISKNSMSYKQLNVNNLMG
jgi:hypothetical protein